MPDAKLSLSLSLSLSLWDKYPPLSLFSLFTMITKWTVDRSISLWGQFYLLGVAGEYSGHGVQLYASISIKHRPVDTFLKGIIKQQALRIHVLNVWARQGSNLFQDGLSKNKNRNMYIYSKEIGKNTRLQMFISQCWETKIRRIMTCLW